MGEVYCRRARWVVATLSRLPLAFAPSSQTSWTILAANGALEIQHRNDRASWDAFVTSINDALNPLDLEFAHLYDEISGQEVYAVVRFQALSSLGRDA